MSSGHTPTCVRCAVTTRNHRRIAPEPRHFEQLTCPFVQRVHFFVPLPRQSRQFTSRKLLRARLICFPVPAHPPQLARRVPLHVGHVT
ncbi:MAG TPA: hypothetical protein VEZ71_16515 [Archangium sp.]|nr:hypothetical protein [Archangium sp.]